LIDLASDRLRIGGIAFEHLYRHRRAVRRAQQSVDDLRSVGAMVASMAVPGEWTAAPLHVARRDVVEDQRAVDEMFPCERRLDASLLLDEPVERGVHLALGNGCEAQRKCQARCRRL